MRHLGDADAALEGSGRRETAVFIVCDRAESYLSCVRARRPELLGRASRGPPRDAHRGRGAGRRPVRDRGTRPAAGSRRATPGRSVVDLRSPTPTPPRTSRARSTSSTSCSRNSSAVGSPSPGGHRYCWPVPSARSLRYAALLTRMGHPDAKPGRRNRRLAGRGRPAGARMSAAPGSGN
ncbi:hypothetical protein LV779_08080 [Streptomyces thinghirensis]|nr:hypothetical protein [Streptomyces thinghirensis]